MRIRDLSSDVCSSDLGYRVIYVLDANAMFLTTVETVRSYQRRPDIASDPGALVVGIGYPPGSDILARRTWDLTMPVDEKRSRAPTGGAKELDRKSTRLNSSH